jgi:hypothetical protein
MKFLSVISSLLFGVISALRSPSLQKTFTQEPVASHIELSHKNSIMPSASLFDFYSSFSSLSSKRRHYRSFSIPSLWYTTVYVDNKVYHPIIDTGSSDVILYSTEKYTNEAVDIAYLSKTVTVHPQNKTIKIADVDYKTTVGWTNVPGYSVLGLGLPKLSLLEKSLALTNKIETITLVYSPRYSYINFNKEPMVDMFYINVEGDTYWDVYLHQILIDHTLLSNKPTTATIDTGTAMIRGPSDQIVSIVTMLQKFRNGTEWDCRDVDNLPILYFEVGFPFPFPKNGLTGSLTLELEPWYYMKNIDGKCLPAFAISESDEWILGEPFLYKFRILLDVKNRQIGFSNSYLTRSILFTPDSSYIDVQKQLAVTSKTTSLLVTIPKPVIMATSTNVAVNSAASSAGGAAASGTATTVTKATARPTPAPAAGTKKYASA